MDLPTFGDVADAFIDYIQGAELVIHNASFDIGFMDYEFGKLNRGIGKTETFCKITDSLAMARKMQAIPSTPISRVIISSGLITVPDRCVFNKGQKIAVEFGTLPNAASKLDGNNYKQSVPIHVECEGGSFSQGALNIELGIQTTTASGTASFNHQLLGTLSNGQKRSDLGILLQDTNGRPVVPDQFYEMKGFYKNQGDWNLTAAPMANAGAGSVKEGEFEASATVVAKFQ